MDGLTITSYDPDLPGSPEACNDFFRLFARLLDENGLPEGCTDPAFRGKVTKLSLTIMDEGKLRISCSDGECFMTIVNGVFTSRMMDLLSARMQYSQPD